MSLNITFPLFARKFILKPLHHFKEIAFIKVNTLRVAKLQCIEKMQFIDELVFGSEPVNHQTVRIPTK